MLEMEALQVRLPVSNSVYAKKHRNGTPSANQVVSIADPDVAMLFAPFGCTQPFPNLLPFLLKQNKGHCQK